MREEHHRCISSHWRAAKSMNPTELLTFFSYYGTWGIFLLAYGEKIIPVVPSYLMLLFVGMLGNTMASLATAVAATVAGSVAGSVTWYGIGRILGEHRVDAAVEKYGRYVFLKAPVYARLVSFFRRNNFVVTFLGQLIPLARIYMALPAGVFRFQTRYFVIAAALGSILYNGIFLLIGFFLRGTSHDLATVGTWILCIILVVEVLCFIAIKKFLKNKLAGH